MAPKCIGKYSRSYLAEKLLYLDGQPFSLKDYPFYYGVYNTDARETLLKTGRQVAKSVVETTPCLLANGSVKPISDICIGDVVISLGETGAELVAAPVVWKSPCYQKACLRITTRLGLTLEVATTHPIRSWDSWVTAGTLRVGTRVAVVRRAGIFTSEHTVDDDLLAFCAFMLGDGSCGKNGTFGFTQRNGVVQREFLRICAARHWKVRAYARKQKNRMFRFLTCAGTAPRTLLEAWGMWCKKSEEKRVPDFVWGLGMRQTAYFLNRLWATDGNVRTTRARATISFSSISYNLISDVQRLLWKFGIPTRLRSRTPRVYRGTNKRVYQLRVETRAGVAEFLSTIGVLGKSENACVPTALERNNRDTLPKECAELIYALHQSGGTTGRRGRAARGSLYSAGLRRTPKYALTRETLRKYVQHFVADPRYDRVLINKLAAHAQRDDLYWDSVVAIKKIGKRQCYDISVAGGSFVANGVVTHNSTYCSNLMIVDSIRIPHFKTLYVTPTREQTSKFSNTRLTKTIHYSPHIRKNYVDPTLPNNVLLQVLRNGSLMVLSYAMDDPDRVRGNTADRDLIDEVQDVHFEAVIPVVKECMSASQYAYMAYCGTPKSMENTIEHLWKMSSRTEWIMRCSGCNTHQFIDSIKSIGKHGVICVKCGKSLNVREGFWYDFNKHGRIKGFHISQPMLPVNNEIQERWDRILDKLETYPESKFKNEVLGVSDAIGTRFISQEELLAMCHDYYIPEAPPVDPALVEDCRYITGGVDWSGGGGDYVSRTVCWVWGYTNEGKYKTIYFKIFPGNNPIEDVEEVARIFSACRCDVVVGDAGEGAVANSHLMRVLGAHRVFQMQYGTFYKLMKWNKKDRYLIDRTAAIDSFMLVLKHQGVIYPNVGQMMVPIQDILAEYEETSQTGYGGVSRKIWRHAPSAPDDCLHAQIFAWLAMKIARQDMELYDAG